MHFDETNFRSCAEESLHFCMLFMAVYSLSIIRKYVSTNFEYLKILYGDPFSKNKCIMNYSSQDRSPDTVFITVIR